MNSIVEFFEKNDFFDSRLYLRSLKDHLFASYDLCKVNRCSERECLLALFHSCYGNIYGYSVQGISYDDRDKVKEILGTELEFLVFTYNSIQAGLGLHAARFIGDECWAANSLFGGVKLSATDFISMLNVYVIETIEQIYYLVEKAKLYSIVELDKHVKKLDEIKVNCSDNVKVEIDKFCLRFL